MISLEGHRIVDLSWELVSRVTRMDQTVEEGKRDVYNMPWIVEETYNEQDGTIEHLVACNAGTVSAWPVGGVSGHMGSHVQLGIGHNDNWTGLPDGMKGIWEMPVATYYGEACVCKLDHLKGQPILAGAPVQRPGRRHRVDGQFQYGRRHPLDRGRYRLLVG